MLNLTRKQRIKAETTGEKYAKALYQSMNYAVCDKTMGNFLGNKID